MPKNKDNENNAQDLQKIAAIREMIANAERTIQSARAMLSQIEGKPGRKIVTRMSDSEEGEVVEGVFDGQVMTGTDGKQYPVPANYASKSKLVEGDMLKLTITPDGSFIYKQIGPAERKRLIGVVSQDDLGNYVVLASGKAYRVLLASVTYFKAEPGDEVTLVVARDSESIWAAIENIVKKGSIGGMGIGSSDGRKNSSSNDDEDDENLSFPIKLEDRLGSDGKLESDMDIIDEWTPNLKKSKKKPASRLFKA